jgi:hypothetical protein
MVVIPTKPVVDATQVKTAVVTSPDLRARFCAAIDGGGEVAGASVANGVAATVAR